MKLLLSHTKRFLNLKTYNKLFKQEKKGFESNLVLTYFDLLKNGKSKDIIFESLSKKYEQDDLIKWLGKTDEEKKIDYDNIINEIQKLEHENRKYGLN